MVSYLVKEVIEIAVVTGEVGVRVFGNVSSAVRSQRMGATIALAMIKSEYAKPGTAVFSVKESERIEGTVSELPFA